MELQYYLELPGAGYNDRFYQSVKCTRMCRRWRGRW